MNVSSIVFSVVCILTRVTDDINYEINMADKVFKPGHVDRTFIDVPDGATWAGNKC